MRLRSLVVGLIGVWTTALGGQTQVPVFRATTETVAVNVSVKDGNVPVQGLTVRDFRLYDNDVAQEIAAVSIDAVPVDLSIVVTNSGNPFIPIDSTRRAVDGIVAFLRPSDRYRVLTTGSAIVNAIPWRAAGAPDTSAIRQVSGETQMIADAVVMALLHRQSPDRRHLVVALGGSQSHCSLASGDALRRSAERSGAVFHWINLRRGLPITLRLWAEDYVDPGVRAFCRLETATGGPNDFESFLTDAARVTGGAVHSAWLGDDKVAVEAFDQIFDDFRRSYVLYYAPQGVERTGWHRLRVEVPTKGLEVRARTGYWGTVTASSAPTAPASQSR
jgi:VWFA-related protein